MRVISRLVRYILDLIEDSLCKLAELAGKAALRPDEFLEILEGHLKKHSAQIPQMIRLTT